MSRNSTSASLRQNSLPVRLLIGFIAGFLAVLVFHQGVLGLLYGLDISPRPPYVTQATPPLGVPQFLSLAFWGGVWGVVLAAIAPRLPRTLPLWLAGLLFGIIGPTAVAWFVVPLLKGAPLGGGWKPAGIVTAILINGAWGLGTALLFWIMEKRSQATG